MQMFGNGTLKSGVPDIGFGLVDVRDLAQAHYAAGFAPDARGRHIVSGHNSSFVEMAQLLLPTYGDSYPIPQRTLPKWLLWIVGPFVSDAMSRQYIKRNVGYPFVADNSKSIQALGVSYRPLAESMNETFQQMIDNGWFD
jgi:nucleoside-diphosphate-sugar epimerase